MRNTPMMASPVEYRETMWGAIYDGEAPRRTERPESSNRTKVSRRGRPALPPGAGSGMTRADANKLNSFRDELMALRERKEAERGSPPEAPATS
jgi:hypothetical protein